MTSEVHPNSKILQGNKDDDNISIIKSHKEVQRQKEIKSKA